jgi:hypothetical protein
MGTKLTALTAIPSVDRAADLLYIVDSSGGTSNKVTPNNLLGFTGGNPVSTTDTQSLTNKTLTSPTITAPSITDANSRVIDLSSSWVNGSGTWTYASATTFTVPAADAALLQKGMHVKLTQSATVKYFDISGVSGTTVTIVANGDYTLANAVISSPAFSSAVSPYGFPLSFSFTPTWTGFSANPTTAVCRFSINGGFCDYWFTASGAGTSNATTTTVTVPITTGSTATMRLPLMAVTDNSVSATTPGVIVISGGSSTIDFRKDGTLAAWTAAGSKSMNWAIRYPI